MKQSQRISIQTSVIVAMLMLATVTSYAMHITEGFLPLNWCLIWGAICLPFLVWGLISIKNKCKGNTRMKMLLAMAGAYCFVLSALKLPSVTGSSSHPTGVGLGAILFGPAVMAVLGLIVLIFQALLLAHGGLTTLGANTFSMAIAGPFVGFGVYWLAKHCTKKLSPRWSRNISVFLGAALADLFTYCVTSVQMALCWQDSTLSFGQSLTKFLSIFAVTQIPLAIVEGILTVLVFSAIQSLCSEELTTLGVVSQ